MFWDVYYDLCKRAGKSATTVCLEIGLSNSAANGWKNGTQPKADVLCKLADYFNVSVDYLLGRESIQNQDVDVQADIHDLSPDDREMLSEVTDVIIKHRRGK